MRLIITTIGMFGYIAEIPAAWITLQNDTKAAMTVQELVTVKGKVVPGKPVKLGPGETLREFHNGTVTKSFRVTETIGNKLATDSDVTVKEKDVTVSISTVAGQLKFVNLAPRK